MPSTFTPNAPATASAVSYAPLQDLRVFSVTGADAVTFLQGQLTNDVASLTPDQAVLAGFCTAKGRMLASMAVWRAPDQGEVVQLLGFMRTSLSEAVLKRLRMFVLRAKAVFDTPALDVAGVWCSPEQVQALSEAAGGALPTVPWTRQELSSGTWISAPTSGNVLRWWWVATAAQRDSASATLAPLMNAADASLWNGLDMLAGLPWIDTPTQDVFIPQTVNLDLIDGVSFTKGCYPGQEVVARSHYRGVIKRRMALGIIKAGSLPEGELRGLDVYDVNVPTEPSGRVIDIGAQPDGSGDTALLFEIPLKSLTDPTLTLGSLDGPIITVAPLPYSYERA